MGWARSRNTEGVSVAATIWGLAELIWALARAQLRTWSLGCALASAVFLRYDNIVLCLLVVLCAFAIHPPLKALTRGLVVALIFVTPLVIWTVRSIKLGLSFPPTMNVVASINPDDSVPYPEGVRKYALSWVVNSTDMKLFTMPAYKGSYRTIRVPDSVFDTAGERREVHEVESELSRYHGARIPRHIDYLFGAIADVRYSTHPWRQIFWLPLERIKAMWIDPYYSWGWPIGFGNAKTSLALERQIDEKGEGALIRIAWANPEFAVGKILVNAYVFGLITAFLLLVILRPPSLSARHVRTIFAIAVVLAVARSLLLAALAQVETRYIIDCIPAMEISVVIGSAGLWQRYMRGPQVPLSETIQ